MNPILKRQSDIYYKDSIFKIHIIERRISAKFAVGNYKEPYRLALVFIFSV